MSTFIEIQNNLLSEFPGMPRAIVKQAINDAYNDLYRKWQWAAFEKTYPLEFVAPYATGTVNVTHDSRLVTLNETHAVGAPTPAWLTSYNGRYIRIAGSDQPYKISGVNIATVTTLILERPYVGATTSFDTNGDGIVDTLYGDTYTIFQHIYSLNSQVKELLSVQLSSNLGEIPRAELDRVDPSRESTGEPTRYAKLGRNTSGTVQIEVWPVPDMDYMARYRARINPISLTNDDDMALVDGQLVEAYSWLRLYPKALRLLNDPTLKDLFQDKKAFAEELYSDSLMEDSRLHSEYEKIRNVTDGNYYQLTNEFYVDHDID
jgi:hypothetical protein